MLSETCFLLFQTRWWRSGRSFREHEPKHFHAEHQAREGKVDFDGNQTVGNITSKNALDLIRQWAVLNPEALESNWPKIKTGQPLDRIPPLD